MEKTGQMIEFEQETGKQSAILKFITGGQALEQKSYPKLGPYDYNMDYIAWLESKAAAYDRLMGGEYTLKDLSNIFQIDGRHSYMGAYNPYQALANAVLEMAKSDWKYYEDNKEVETFLQGDLVDFYLNLADIDKGKYLAEVRSQRLRWRSPKKAGVSNYEAQEIKEETCGDTGGGLHPDNGKAV